MNEDHLDYLEWTGEIVATIFIVWGIMLIAYAIEKLLKKLKLMNEDTQNKIIENFNANFFLALT